MIAITGIGILSPAGIGKEGLLQSFAASRSGISEPAGFGLPCNGITRLAMVRNFSAKDYIPAIKARRMSRFSQLGLASAIEAVGDAGIEVNDSNCYRIAIAVGTGLASTGSTDRFYEGLLREGPEATNPIIFPETVQNIAASHMAMHFVSRGQNITFSHADISSELALMYGTELLKEGQADVVIVSGADELSISAVIGYSSFGVVSNNMRPYDRRRNGFVLGEGGATIILERLDDARKRNARVYCTVGSVEIASHPAPNISYDASRVSMKRAIQAALAAAGLSLPEFISACANATPDLDRLEADALGETVGTSVPVTAYRSYHGYFPGDGILRVAATALCMDRGILPAIAGLDQPFEECGLDLVLGSPRKLQAGSALISSFSTGGSAAGIVLNKER
jgi:3-oxoacyl-[acyl-carrier-protein] synthase II